MIRRAMQAAADRGMRFMPDLVKPGIADIFCAECGWPDSHRGTKIEQYVREPYGCARCSEGENEPPR